MAITAQELKLQFAGGQLGGADKLQAGSYQLLKNYDGQSHSVTVMLFAGPRPSKEEIENGEYFFINDPLYHAVGGFSLHRSTFTQLVAPPAQLLGDAALNDPAMHNGLYTPVDASLMSQSDGQELLHAVFQPHRLYGRYNGSYSQTRVPEVLQKLGNGNAPTWGLVSLHDGQPTHSGAFEYLGRLGSSEFRRHDGKNIKLSVYRPVPAFSHYITVGSLKDEPTANLVLHRGAEADMDEIPKTIRVHRLRVRTNPLRAAKLGA